MIHVFMLTVFVIYLPHVKAMNGTSCIGDIEACSSLGSYQCNAGYRIHIFCKPVSEDDKSCPHTSQCMACNSTNGLGMCYCNSPVFYENQGYCYFKHDFNATCYTEDSCRDVNSMCSNSSGGICVCKPGHYFHYYGKCVPLQPVGGFCNGDDECRDEHARCIGYRPTCTCMDDYYGHKGSCVLKGNYNETCYTAEGCVNTTNLVCSNSSGGICVCQTGYYFHRYGRCTEKQIIGQECYSHDECIDEHARCIGGPPVCSCMDGYYAHQGYCIPKAYLGGICQNQDGCTGDGVICSSLYNGTCACNSTHIHYQENCYQKPDSPQNLLVLNVTSRSFTIGFTKPNEVFGELVGYALKITIAETGRCVIEYLIRCTSGCIAPFPNPTALPTTCLGIIQYQNVNKYDLVIMKHDENTLDPGTVYWISVAAVSQYGKGFTSDINVTTLHQDDIKIGSNSESGSMTTIIIASIACGTVIVIALTVAGTVIIKRKRTSKGKSETDAGSAYMDLQRKTNEDHYDTLAVTTKY